MKDKEWEEWKIKGEGRRWDYKLGEGKIKRPD
jgi:hypothetical protein